MHEFGVFLEQEFVALLGIGGEVGEESFLLFGEAVVGFFPEEMFHFMKRGTELFAAFEGEAQQFAVFHRGNVEDGFRVMVEGVLVGDPAAFVGELDDVFFAVGRRERGGEKSFLCPVGMLNVVAGAHQELMLLEFLYGEIFQDLPELGVTNFHEAFQVLFEIDAGGGCRLHHKLFKVQKIMFALERVASER